MKLEVWIPLIIVALTTGATLVALHQRVENMQEQQRTVGARALEDLHKLQIRVTIIEARCKCVEQ